MTPTFGETDRTLDDYAEALMPYLCSVCEKSIVPAGSTESVVGDRHFHNACIEKLLEHVDVFVPSIPLEDAPEIESPLLRDPIVDVDIKTTVGEIPVVPFVPGGPVDATMPDGAWKFDEDVTDAFDDMLERSIPQYDVMRDTVVDVLDAFVDRRNQAGPRVLDLGTSRGEMLDRIIRRFGATATYVGTDVSEPMLAAARERFDMWSDYVTIEYSDLRTSFPVGSFDAIVSALTLQFVPIEYREKIVSAAYDALNPGGVLIVVEKILGEGSLIDEKMVEIYLAMKEKNGYPREAIDRKRLALEGVLVPITANWNRDLLATAGFRHVDVFWRWMNFAAWVAVK